MNTKLSFASDYMEGAHPSILETLQETNFLASPGYGTDSFTESAKQKIREACRRRMQRCIFWLEEPRPMLR